MPLEVVAGLLVGAVVLLQPLKYLDNWANARLLEALGRRAPPQHLVLLQLTGDSLRDRDCAPGLLRALSHSGARGALVLPPGDELCGVETRSTGAVPIVVLPHDALRHLPTGEVIGFHPRPVDQPLLASIGIEDGRWVAPRDWRAIPSVTYTDLRAGRLPDDVLRDRLVVVAVGSVTSEAGRATFAQRVAAAGAAALEDRPRRALAASWAAIGALVWATAWFWSRRRSLPRAWRLSLWAVLLTLALAAAGGGLFGLGYLWPLCSVALGLGLGFSAREFPSFLAARRAGARASELLDRATQIGSQATHQLSDADFWDGLARRIAGAHPADGVLVAELPPFAWRLRVHPNGDLTEAIITERRRDIRRTPYVDEAGRRAIKVHYGFVAMKEVPTVLMPLETQGEPEGFVFLFGKVAEKAFIERPDLTQQLADELTLLIRNRRLERFRATEWQRSAGVVVTDPGGRAANMIDGARGALERLALLQQVLTSAPVALLYADSFGDVRVMGESFASHLRAYGADPPELGPGGSLPAGKLELGQVLAQLAEAAGVAPPKLDEIHQEPYELSLPAPPGSAHTDRKVSLAVRRFESADGPGFVASLFRAPAAADTPANVERVPQRGDPLTTFSLTELLLDTVDVCARRAQGKIKLQTPRVLAHVVGHRRELAGALEDFLLDAAGIDGKRSTPILRVQERHHRIELTILDLQLGAPGAAIKRTLLAPSQPPPGLVSLGGLARAVENSHGGVSLQQEEGWGMKLTLSLIRARPRVQARTASGVLNLPRAPRVPGRG